MLETIKTLLIWFGMCPSEISTRVTKSIALIVFPWIVIFLLAIALTVHLAAISMFLNKNLELSDALFAFMGFGCVSGIAYVSVNTIVTRHKIGNIFETLSVIYNSGILIYCLFEYNDSKFNYFLISFKYS